MSLPINISELLHGQTLEWDRLEFKSPEPIFETNDDRNYFLTILMAHPLVKKTSKGKKRIIPGKNVPENVQENVQEKRIFKIFLA